MKAFRFVLVAGFPARRGVNPKRNRAIGAGYVERRGRGFHKTDPGRP